MKLFRIFAVGLILSAVVVSTALAPIGNAVGQTGSGTVLFSDKLFTLPAFNIANFTILPLDYTDPSTTTTGPSSDPPEADVVPNFSGLVVNGPTAIDSDDDDTDDLIIDKNGKIFINNRLEVDADDDGDEELRIIPGLITLGDFPGGESMAITPILNMVKIVTRDPGFFIVESPSVKFAMPTNAAGDVDFEIEGDLQVDGKIETASTIGSHYINRQEATSETEAIATCDTGHVMTGCSGRAPSTTFKGTAPDGTSCTAYRGTSGTIYAYAHCFDPSGITDPDTYYYP
jgi:hypothetical protein